MKIILIVLLPVVAFTGATGYAQRADAPEAHDVSYTYDPMDRPDPFVSQLQGRHEERKLPPGAITIESAVLVGITAGPDGYVALLKGPDGKTRFLKAGADLYDGQILDIDSRRVVFRQDIHDVSSPVRAREVIKALHPESDSRR